MKAVAGYPLLHHFPGPSSATQCRVFSKIDGADLALIADCVPFASPNTHADFIKDHAIAVGCPKLDDGRAYIAKLAQILRNNEVRSVTVVHMEVPCCGGLEFIAAQALAQSGKDIPLESVIVNIGN